MIEEKPIRRLTLRQLLTHAEKSARDLVEHCNNQMMNQMSEFRDLSRPVRRRSHYPTMLAVQNSLKKLMQLTDEAVTAAESLQEQMQAIRDHATRERITRR